MHRALAEHGAADPDFAPEPISSEDLEEWRDELEITAVDTLDALQRALPRLPEATRVLGSQLLSEQGTLFRLIGGLTPAEITAHKTRYHGNYHLGQVLAVQNDFVIAGFAGMPHLPLAARRKKASPLRDVAAMIRSFDYAAVAAVHQLAESRPSALPRMAMLAETWRQRAIDGFRAAYRKSMRGCVSYPASKREVRELTAFFVLERAVLELSHELANRPSLAAIPLRGILDIISRHGRQAGGYAASAP